MNRYVFVLFYALLEVSNVCAQPEQPAIEGYVTRATSGSDFDVNGIRVLCRGAKSNLFSTSHGGSNAIQACPQIFPYVGEQLRIYGHQNYKTHTVDPRQIDLMQAPPGIVSGTAVIDALPNHDAAPAPATELLVRADGYRILIGAKTRIVWAGSRHALSDVKTGDWIEYKGKENADGTVSAESVRFAPDAVSQSEQKLRAKNDFDPAAVPSSAKQGAFSAAFTGIDPKRFPPYDDPVMQARVTAIGEKLIPAYQRNLPKTDPAKIQFRFQVIDTKLSRDALTLPSGVILVPRQVVERMQNDSQLAAVLGDNIACALEKQTYRALPATRALAAEYYGTQVAGLIVPGLGLAGIGAGLGGSEALKIKTVHQSGRVSLGLLYDAGFDIDQAPLAWWLLAPTKPKPLWEVQLPDRAAYLYRILGQTWHNSAAGASLKN